MTFWAIQWFFCTAYFPMVAAMVTLTVPKGATGGVMGLFEAVRGLGSIFMLILY